jgi:DMSO reductase anchor subunit
MLIVQPVYFFAVLAILSLGAFIFTLYRIFFYKDGSKGRFIYLVAYGVTAVVGILGFLLTYDR